MKREIYDEDHEAFRASVKEFLDREVVPHLDEYAARPRAAARVLAGRRQAGLPRPRDPRAVRRLRGRRLPLQRGAHRGARQGQHDPAELRRHPRRHRRALPRAPHQRRAEGALAAAVLHRRAAHRDRHDRARRRLRPRQPEDHRRPRRRRLDHQRLQDLHHQRRQRRPGRGRRAHQPGEEGQGHLALRRRHHARRLLRRPGARQGRPGRVRHRRAVLRGRPRQQRRPDRPARHRLHLDDAVPAAGAPRLGDHQPRPRRADPRGDDPVRQGAQGLRPADRQLPAQRRS